MRSPDKSGHRAGGRHYGMSSIFQTRSANSFRITDQQKRWDPMVDIPEHLIRHPTRRAIDALAARFSLGRDPYMQDWEWEVADPERLDEFLAAYDLPELTEDERFVLAEVIIQSFEDSPADLEHDSRWRTVLDRLDRSIAIHAHTVWYWSCGDEALEDCWRVTPYLRLVRDRHQHLAQG
jgi:hypothetical protein